jgi:hypothetical protein
MRATRMMAFRPSRILSNAGLEADDNPDALLAHVWAYEVAHKNRVRILKFLEELAAERNQPELEEQPAAVEESVEESDPATEALEEAASEAEEQLC